MLAQLGDQHKWVLTLTSPASVRITLSNLAAPYALHVLSDPSAQGLLAELTDPSTNDKSLSLSLAAQTYLIYVDSPSGKTTPVAYQLAVLADTGAASSAAPPAPGLQPASNQFSHAAPRLLPVLYDAAHGGVILRWRLDEQFVAGEEFHIYVNEPDGKQSEDGAPGTADEHDETFNCGNLGIDRPACTLPAGTYTYTVVVQSSLVHPPGCPNCPAPISPSANGSFQWPLTAGAPTPSESSVLLATPNINVFAPLPGFSIPVESTIALRLTVSGASGAYAAGQPYRMFPLIVQINRRGDRGFSSATLGQLHAVTDAQGAYHGTYPAPSQSGSFDLVIYPNYADARYGGNGAEFEGHPTPSRGWVDGTPQPWMAIPFQAN